MDLPAGPSPRRSLEGLLVLARRIRPARISLDEFVKRDSSRTNSSSENQEAFQASPRTRSGWEVQTLFPRWLRISLKPTRTLQQSAVRESILCGFCIWCSKIIIFYGFCIWCSIIIIFIWSSISDAHKSLFPVERSNFRSNVWKNEE